MVDPPEEDDASLSDQQRKLVALLVGQILELKALDFRANVAGEMRHFGGSIQQRALALIGSGSAGPSIVMHPRFVANLKGVLKIEWTGRAVWIASRQIDAGLCQPLAGWSR